MRVVGIAALMEASCISARVAGALRKIASAAFANASQLVITERIFETVAYHLEAYIMHAKLQHFAFDTITIVLWEIASKCPAHCVTNHCRLHVAVPRKSKQQLAFIERLALGPDGLEVGYASNGQPRLLSSFHAWKAFDSRQEVGASARRFHSLVIVPVVDVRVIIVRFICDCVLGRVRCSFEFTSHTEIAIELLNAKMAERWMTKEKLLREVQVILRVWIIWVFRNVVRVSLCSILGIAHKFGMNLLNWFSRSNHVEVHETIEGHADAHRAALDPVTQAILRRFEMIPLLWF